MSYIEKFWRDATAADVVDVMAGKEVEARFSNASPFCGGGVYGLSGWKMIDGAGRWIDDGASSWRYCQVYAPPQWYSDKPEPGEGYRLLGKFPDEALQAGDEVRKADRWDISGGAELGQTQLPFLWYRRRIEQPKPEPKFAVGQRVKIIGPKEKPAVHWDGIMDKHTNTVAEVVSVSCMVGEKVFYDLRSIEHWAFREDYLEPVVEPEPKHYSLQVGDTCDIPSGHRLAVTEHGVEVT